MQGSRREFLATAAVLSGLSVLGNQGIQAMEPIDRSHGPHIKLSLAAYSYRKYLQQEKSMTMMEFLDECAKLGLGAAEPTSYYFPPDADKQYFLDFKRHAHLLGLDISGTAIGNSFTSPPGEEREKQLDSLKQWVDNAALFGAPCIRIFAGNVPKGLSEEQAIQNVIETTREACDYAATKGVFLALENHGGVVATPAGMLKIIEQVDSPWFGVNFDSGNFHTEDPYGDLKKIAPFTINAQIKVEMRPAGAKRNEPADMRRIIEILREADYRGYVALEYEAGEEPKEAVPRHLDELRQILWG
ncbi:MAG: sugar phosphate isomerase/epimerase family protein [bacterium]|jgi:sugar phosphate isomerase/epimerase